MKTKKNLESILSILAAELTRLGAERVKRNVFRISFDGDSSGWIGLNRALYENGKIVDINPIVGVRSSRVESLVAELCGQKDDGISPPTISANIGYLGSNGAYVTYMFRDEEAWAAMAREVCDKISVLGIPFMRNHLDLEHISVAMEMPVFSIKPATDYKFPVVLYLLGRYDECMDRIDKILCEYDGRSDEAASIYRIFAGRLKERCIREGRVSN